VPHGQTYPKGNGGEKKIWCAHFVVDVLRRFSATVRTAGALFEKGRVVLSGARALREAGMRLVEEGKNSEKSGKKKGPNRLFRKMRK